MLLITGKPLQKTNKQTSKQTNRKKTSQCIQSNNNKKESKCDREYDNNKKESKCDRECDSNEHEIWALQPNKPGCDTREKNKTKQNINLNPEISATVTCRRRGNK